jgi:hypothetical protein
MNAYQSENDLLPISKRGPQDRSASSFRRICPADREEGNRLKGWRASDATKRGTVKTSGSKPDRNQFKMVIFRGYFEIKAVSLSECQSTDAQHSTCFRMPFIVAGAQNAGQAFVTRRSFEFAGPATNLLLRGLDLVIYSECRLTQIDARTFSRFLQVSMNALLNDRCLLRAADWPRAPGNPSRPSTPRVRCTCGHRFIRSSFLMRYIFPSSCVLWLPGHRLRCPASSDCDCPRYAAAITRFRRHRQTTSENGDQTWFTSHAAARVALRGGISTSPDLFLRLRIGRLIDAASCQGRGRSFCLR